MSLSNRATVQEILSQPDVWHATIQRLANSDLPSSKNISTYSQIIFTGCGSTYYLSLWAARIAEKAHGVFARGIPASDLLLFPNVWMHNDGRTLLVAISRSGETSETLRVVEIFNSGGYGDSLAVTCYPDRSLGKIANVTIGVPDAQEASVVQTRSFTSMMLAILMWLLPPAPSQIEERLRTAAKGLFDKYTDLAHQINDDKKLQQFFFLGSGALFGLASEAMLKMKEMSLSHAEAYHFLEFRHGPKSIVDRNSLVIGLLSEAASGYEIQVLREMRGLDARILVLAESFNNDLAKIADDVLVLDSGLPEEWRGPLYLPILQLIALRKAFTKGLDPDHPVNLDAVVYLDGIQ